MNDRLKSFIQRLDPAAIAFAAIAVSLYIPVLHYSLNTPFSLIDDYASWRFINVFNRFYQWLGSVFLGYDWGYDWYAPWRHRPFWEFYNAVVWKAFGPVPWLHHLARWVEHFGAVAAFAAAFLCFQRRNGDGNGDSAATGRFIRLLPLTALVYLWIFFPNQPAARLAPQEVHTVFFLGICAWMLALTLLRHGKAQTRRAALLIYAAFCVGFCGVAWSKEANIAAALWLLIAYFALLAIEALRRQAGSRICAARALKDISLWKTLGGLPLIAIALHSLVEVYFASQVGGYGAGAVTPELLANNAAWIASELFQIHTSPIIAVGLALLSATLLLFIAVNIARRRFSDDLIFILFLLGLFASLYLILCAPPHQALRYWHILIPLFTTLLAFSIKFTLAFAARFNLARMPIRPQNLAAYALTAFMAFFVCCNYYNFLNQTVVQHIARHSEANLIAEITRLLDREEYVHISNARPHEHDEYLILLTLYYQEFLPQFYGKKYNVHAEPPQEVGQPHHIVRHFATVAPPPRIQESYRPLAYAYRVADFLQTGAPYDKRDAATGIALWHIYDNELNRIWWDGDTLDIRQLVADAGSPIIRSNFDVYLNDRRLIYTTDQCSAANLDNAFFLGVFPVDNDVLPEALKPHGFDNFGFDFADYGFRSGEICLAVRQLPEYPIQRIHTGQFVATEDGYHNIWEADAALPARRISNAADIQRLLDGAGSPIIRSDFDVYLNDGWLIYTTDQCSAANLDDTFFLGVFPVDNNDLPDARKPLGFESIGFDFAYYGFRSGERCFAAHDLPEYPIQRIHTGQYVASEDGWRNTWEGDVVLSGQ